jgi:hypothetical protein
MQHYLFPLFFALFCAACATTADKSLTTSKAEGVDFAAFRSFEWMPDAGDSINNMSIFDNQILRNRMHRAIEKELTNRRVLPGTGSGDLKIQLVVRNRGQMATRTQTNNNDPYWNNRRFPNNTNTTTTSTPVFSQHREVIVNAYDRSNNLVWSGAIITDYKEAPELQKNIERDINKLMSQYPIK